MIRIFISYRSLDSTHVDTIVARMRSLKNADGTPRYTLWQDKHDILDGQDWWEAIGNAIIACDVFIFMVSRESVKNINCKAELSYARKRNRPVVPLVVEGEFSYNPITGKNDIDYWGDVPQELHDLRAQFLFYEGSSFLPRLEAAFAAFKREPQRWRDLPAQRPRDPRDASDETNNTIALYDEACDYAWRLEIPTAERLFQKLVNLNDPDFANDAHEWILLLREYQTLLSLDARQSTRHKVKARWEQYEQLFPKPFIEGIYDPKGLRQRDIDQSVSVLPTSPPKPAPPTSPAPVRKFSVDLLPAPFALIEIPGNIGKTWQGGPFLIAKYPVTNAQYALFIRSGGYREKKWWTEAGWTQRERDKWTKPRFWKNTKLNGAEQPVVGVSWFEAVAFCLWLSDMTGEKIMLPTEDQWQYAARGDDGRDYPWGKTWDGSRCNNNVGNKGDGRTTPVRQYEGKGDSPFGVVDMAGNVWEWCLTDYDNRTNDINSIANNRVLRGGSWDDSRIDWFRCVNRGRYSPHDWGDFRGFRLALYLGNWASN